MSRWGVFSWWLITFFVILISALIYAGVSDYHYNMGIYNVMQHEASDCQDGTKQQQYEAQKTSVENDWATYKRTVEYHLPDLTIPDQRKEITQACEALIAASVEKPTWWKKYSLDSYAEHQLLNEVSTHVGKPMYIYGIAQSTVKKAQEVQQFNNVVRPLVEAKLSNAVDSVTALDLMEEADRDYYGCIVNLEQGKWEAAYPLCMRSRDEAQKAYFQALPAIP